MAIGKWIEAAEQATADIYVDVLQAYLETRYASVLSQLQGSLLISPKLFLDFCNYGWGRRLKFENKPLTTRVFKPYRAAQLPVCIIYVCFPNYGGCGQKSLHIRPTLAFLDEDFKSKLVDLKAILTMFSPVDTVNDIEDCKVAPIAHALIHPNSLPFLARKCEEVWTPWVQLLNKTDLSGCQSCSDARISTALQAPSEATSGREGKLISRLAFALLIDVLERSGRAISTATATVLG